MDIKDLLFVGMDMVKAPRKILDTKEAEVCVHMTENEREAYVFGLDTFASFLEAMLRPEENEIFVHIPGAETMEKFDVDDLIERIK